MKEIGMGGGGTSIEWRPADQRRLASSRRPRVSVLVIASDGSLRATLTAACDASGRSARSVASVAELEQWPIRQAVVTDLAHLTPFWIDVGATHVIALVDDAAEATAALSRGATHWLLRDRSAGRHLLDVLTSPQGNTIHSLRS